MNENMIFKDHVSVMNVDIHNDEIESTKAVLRSFDYDTGKFTYKLTKDGVPLSLSTASKVNVTLMFGGEAKAILDATTVDSIESIISFVYPEQFLSYSGQVLGEVSIQYSNGQSLVAGYFSLVVKGSHIDEQSGEIQKFYVQRFEDLDSLITEQSKEVEVKVGDMTEKVTEIEKKIEDNDVVTVPLFNKEAAKKHEMGNLKDFRSQDSDVIQKMKNQFENTYVDASWFCIADGIFDDTQNLKVAVLRAKELKVKLYIPFSLKIRITSTVDMTGIFIESIGEIIVDFNGIGIVLGHVSTQSHGRENYIRVITHTNFKNGDISLRIQGAKRLNFKLWDLQCVQLYADGDISQISSTAYNIITVVGYIRRFEIFSKLDATAQGWINENTIIKGKFNDILIDGNYSHNKNTFIDSCIEGGTIDIKNGNSNHFLTIRNESIKSVNFGIDSYRNSIQYAYYSSNSMLQYANVVDNGTGNAVYSINEFMPTINVLELTRLNVDKSSAVLKEGLTTTDDFINVKAWQKFISFELSIENFYQLECVLNEKNNAGIRYYFTALDSSKMPIIEPGILWIGGSSFNNETGVYSAGSDQRGFKMLVHKPKKAKYVLIEVGSSKVLNIKRILLKAKITVTSVDNLEIEKPVF